MIARSNRSSVDSLSSSSSRISSTAWIALLVVAGATAGCNDDADGTGGSGGGDSGSTTSSSTSTASSSTGGAVCEPGSTRTCYAGPVGTDGVGVCKAGTETCNAAGDGYGACVGEVLPSLETCGDAGDEDCDGKALACQTFGDVQWVGPGNHWLAAMASDADGNLLLGGYFEGTITLGSLTLTSPPTGNAFIAKTSPAGEFLWAKQFGDGTGSDVYRIAVDSHANILLALDFYGSADFGGGVLTNPSNTADLAVVKLDPNGAHVWSKRFGDTDDQAAFALTVDHDDDVVVAGGFRGTMDFGTGPLTSAGVGDVYVAKLAAADGAGIWSKRFGGATANEAAFGVAVDSTNAILLAGPIDGEADFGGGVLTSQGLGDVFVAKLDTDGHHVFSERFGDAEVQWANDIAVGPNDSIVLAGEFVGSMSFGAAGTITAQDNDGFVLSLTSAGTPTWVTTLPGPSEQTPTRLALDAAGHIFIVGYTQQPFVFDSAMVGVADRQSGFLAEFGTDGAPIQAITVASDASMSVDAIAIRGTSIVIAGGMNGVATLAGQTFGEASQSGFYFAPYWP